MEKIEDYQVVGVIETDIGALQLLVDPETVRRYGPGNGQVSGDMIALANPYRLKEGGITMVSRKEKFFACYDGTKVPFLQFSCDLYEVDCKVGDAVRS